MLALVVLHSRCLPCSCALLVVACADVLGEVAVGPPPGQAPAVESSAGSLATPPLEVAPTPLGEALPVGAALESPDALQPEPEPEPAAAPMACESGAFRCLGAEVQFCLNGATWIPWQTCGSPRLCQSEPAGRCIPALCAAGEQRCVGGSLQRCDEELSGWSEVELCVSSAHCDPRQSQCLGAPCEIGQQRCNGDQLEACSAARLGWVALEQCASAALCRGEAEPGTATCAAPACSAGDFRCDDSGVLQVCNTELTGFSNLAQCTTPALCDAERGRCEAPACSPGQHACTPAGELLICNAARTGFASRQPAVVCGERETCDALRGVCEPIPLPPPPPPPPAVEEPDDPPPVIEEEEEEEGRRGNGRRGRNDDDDDDDDDRRGRSRDDD